LRDFFGPGCHRLGLQLRLPDAGTGVGGQHRLPTRALDQLFYHVEELGLVLRSLVGRGAGASFGLGRLANDEVPLDRPLLLPGVTVAPVRGHH
jgi:hypothetical protein